MTTELALIPKNESVSYKNPIGYYNSTVNVDLMPYGSEAKISETIQTHHIKMPFKKIISRADGTSECPFCKAVYAGHEVYCTNQVYQATYGEYNHTVKIPSLVSKGDRINPSLLSERWSVVKSFKQVECQTETKWSLAEEFSNQSAFFRFVSWLGQLDPNYQNDIQKYAQYLPVGAQDQYRLMYLEKSNSELQSQVAMMGIAIQTIAQKMNAAGGNLSF